MNKRLTLLGLSLAAAVQLHAIENLMMTFKYGLTDLDGSLSINKHTFGFDMMIDNANNFKPKFDFTYLSVDEGGDGVDYTMQFAVNAMYEGTEVYNNVWIPYFYGGVGYEYVHNDRPEFESAPYVQLAGGVEFPFFGYQNDDYKIIAEARWMQMVADGAQDSEAAVFVGFRISTGALGRSSYRDDYFSYGDERSLNYVELEADDVPTNTPELVKEHVVFSDTDGDGVADKDDRCPHTKRGVMVDEHGCPIGRSATTAKYVSVSAIKQKTRQDKFRIPPLPRKRVMFSVNYSPNQIDLPAKDREEIRKLVKRLNRSGYRYITIEGYTDNSGTPEQNQEISQKRAEVVKNLMVQYGIDPEKITAIGKGELNPIANNEVPEGRALNRRIEIIIE